MSKFKFLKISKIYLNLVLMIIFIVLIRMDSIQKMNGKNLSKRISSLNIPLAGKTGTTNENKDSWFVGFSPDLVIGVYVGFDKPKNLGFKQTGSSVAVPIFKDFIEKANIN